MAARCPKDCAALDCFLHSFFPGDKQTKRKLRYNAVELPQGTPTFLGLLQREFYLLGHSHSRSKYVEPVLEKQIEMMCYRLPFKLSHHVIF